MIDKNLRCAGLGAALFLVTSLPQLYSQTHRYAVSTTGLSNCPNHKSKLLHMLLFFVLNLAVIRYFNDMSWEASIKYAIYGSLLFFFLSSTEMYMLTDTAVDTSTAGCPSMTGVVVHAVVYGAALYGLMYLGKDNE